MGKRNFVNLDLGYSLSYQNWDSTIDGTLTFWNLGDFFLMSKVGLCNGWEPQHIGSQAIFCMMSELGLHTLLGREHLEAWTLDISLSCQNLDSTIDETHKFWNLSYFFLMSNSGLHNWWDPPLSEAQHFSSDVKTGTPQFMGQRNFGRLVISLWYQNWDSTLDWTTVSRNLVRTLGLPLDIIPQTFV